MEVFPDAKVILNVRDPERWYKSVRETIYQMDHIGPEYVENVSSRSLKKPVTREN